MSELLSLVELAEGVNAWCGQHGVAPANGQSGEVLTERNLRYYRSMGLIDPPLAGGGQGYGDKHRLQLIAIRLLQSQGLPLSRIRSLLVGRSLEELRRIQNQGVKELQSNRLPSVQPILSETWTVVPLDDEFLLISRRGRPVTQELRRRVSDLLQEAMSQPEPR